MRGLRRGECAVLPLVLTGRWYDMVASGEKREMYRPDTPYWEARIRNWEQARDRPGCRFCVVELRRGYAKDAPRMAFKAAACHTDSAAAFPEWGEPDAPRYVISLGGRVELETIALERANAVRRMREALRDIECRAASALAGQTDDEGANRARLAAALAVIGRRVRSAAWWEAAP